MMGCGGLHSERQQKILIAAGIARQHHQQYKEQPKEMDHRSGSGGFSEYPGGFHRFPERRCAKRFKASSVTTQSLFHQGEDSK